MNEWLNDFPIFWSKIVATLTFAGGVLWTWIRPKSFIFKDAPDEKKWRDLRIWITVIMISQIVIYLYF
ncbi:hypothetical protein JW979_09425 [bacterium]|nr:hypothetical protein [candidate division CSSED10-310 bacterium]